MCQLSRTVGALLLSGEKRKKKQVLNCGRRLLCGDLWSISQKSKGFGGISGNKGLFPLISELPSLEIEKCLLRVKRNMGCKQFGEGSDYVYACFIKIKLCIILC